MEWLVTFATLVVLIVVVVLVVRSVSGLGKKPPPSELQP
jgi:hypothetical protein